MYYFQNRHIYPLKIMYSFQAHIELPPPLPLVQTPVPTPLKSPPSSHWLYDLQDALDKLINIFPQLSDFVPLKNGFYSFHEQTN